MSTKIKVKDFNIEKEVVILLQNKPFYGHFLQNFRRIVTKDVPTLGVNITDKINLYINPDFYGKLTIPERVGVLEHEILHIISKHIMRSKGKNHEIYNIASDISINQYITSYTDGRGINISVLPKGCLMPETFKLPPKKTAEEYYKLLLKNAKKIKISMKGGKGKLDSHDKWEEGDISEDLQAQIVKNAIKKTMEKSKEWGNLPSNIQAEINKILFHETINWKRALQKFIYRATIVNSVPTRKKPNRRYGFTCEGSKVECKLDMLIALDTSGSVSDNDLGIFFSEIEKIKALGMEILIVEVDTQITKAYKYKNIPKAVTGRGGTSFEPLFEYVSKMKMKPNCIVYLTDLYANLKFSNISKVPTLWAITSDGGDIENIPFGAGIKLKNDAEKNNE